MNHRPASENGLTSERRLLRPRTIPSLDGWRAISILLVVALHSLQASGLHLGSATATLLLVLLNGGLGVRIFFVISGYLITRLLLRENGQTGRISLGRFYIRRAFRILPPFYVYLACVAMLARLGRLHLPGRVFAVVALFLSSYITVPSNVTFWPLEHTWSLCLEEQFYLLWPAVLIWALRPNDATRRQKRAMGVVLAAIVVIPLGRVVWYLPPFGAMHFLGSALFQLDVILFGVLAAVGEGHAAFERYIHWGTRYPLLLGTLLYLVSGWFEVRYGGSYMKSIGATINGLLIMLLLLWSVRHAESMFARFLNWKPITMIGVLSYSLYLWQTLFLHEKNAAIFRRHISLSVAYPAIAACSAASYHLVEKPMLRLRERLMRRPAPIAAGRSLESI